MTATQAHVDASSGASGDMWLGALVDAGASIEAIQAAVDALGAGNVRLTVARVRRAGVTATAVRVHAPQETPTARSWADVRDLLTDAALDPDVRARATATFERIAAAEATVHGVPVDEVAFHEVGALDAIADIVGTAAGIADLGIDRLTCGPVAVGGGRVGAVHGSLPVPPPAVTSLLRGFVIEGGPAAFELTTPTGAALLAEFTTPVDRLPPLRLSVTGVGAGGRDLDHPNVLRLLVGTPADTHSDAHGDPHDETIVLEATVDDLSPELVPVVLDRLRDAGAHDAWATPVLMKKGRPGFTLSALADQGALEGLRTVLFRESTTIGVRWYRVGKHALEREWIEVDVDGHPVRVKVARHDGRIATASPEFEDVAAVAAATGRPVRDVHAAATARAARALGGAGH